MSEPRPRRAAVTGIGVVAPNGSSTETFWKSTREGISVLDRVTREGCEDLPLRVAGQVRDFDPSAAIEERFLVQTDRFTHFAMAAADLALDDARLPRSVTDEVPFSVGVVTAAGSGGGEFDSANSSSCGARAVASSARTSPSPGSTPPAPARSPSAAASRAPARSSPPTRPAAWTPWPTRHAPYGAAPM